MEQKNRVLIILLILIVLIIPTSAKVISFEEQYQDYLGNWHKYNDVNILLFPMYFQNGDATNRTFSTMGNTIIIPKTMDVILSDHKIRPSLTFPKTQLASRMINYNTTVAYLVFPYSLSRVKDFADDHNIRLGRWNFDTSISIHDSNGTTFDSQFYDFKIVNDEIRLYFNKSEANKLVGDITFQMNSWTINNATTSGFTTANVSLNGSRWTDSGQLAINLRNDSQLNMSGLIGYWSMDENSGTIIHNVNTESGLVNTTNQGTWYGNTTLNYSTGVIGNAGNFDGVDDYVTTGNNLNGLTYPLTISFWYNPVRLLTENGSLFAIPGIGIAGRFNTGASEYLHVGTSSNRVGLSKTLFSNNTWSMVTIVYISASNIVAYHNGSNKTVASGDYWSVGGSTNFELMSRAGGLAIAAGSIDEVLIYNRALSASEIAVLYNTSMRTQGNITILNQSANAGNVINRTRIVYTGKDSINNAPIYARQNGTTTWSLVQNNATSNIWYPITNQFNSMDFAVELQGNGSNTPFFSSLEWDENPVIASTPTNLQNTTGNFWIKHTWQGTSQNYNVSINGTWHNGTTDLFFNNSGLTPHNWSNISVAGYNSSGGLSNLSSFISMNTQLPNNIPSYTILTNKIIYSGTNLNLSLNGSDLDGDVLTYSSNVTIGSFNVNTGQYNYTAIDSDKGNYTFYFNVSDGYGMYSQVITITVISLQDQLLEMISELPTKGDVSNAGTMGFIGGIMGGMIVISIIKRNRKN